MGRGGVLSFYVSLKGTDMKRYVLESRDRSGMCRKVFEQPSIFICSAFKPREVILLHKCLSFSPESYVLVVSTTEWLSSSEQRFKKKKKLSLFNAEVIKHASRGRRFLKH